MESKAKSATGPRLGREGARSPLEEAMIFIYALAAPSVVVVLIVVAVLSGLADRRRDEREAARDAIVREFDPDYRRGNKVAEFQVEEWPREHRKIRSSSWTGRC